MKEEVTHIADNHESYYTLCGMPIENVVFLDFLYQITLAASFYCSDCEREILDDADPGLAGLTRIRREKLS